MMKRLFEIATTKLADATRYAASKTNDRSDESPTPITDGGEPRRIDDTGPESDATDGSAEARPDTDDLTEAEALLYADETEFEAAFDAEWPSVPGEDLRWLVEEAESEPLLIAYDRDSDSDDEFLQAPAHLRSDGGASSVEK